MKNKLSIIIPLFNEEEAIPYLYNRLIKVAEKIDNYDLEFLFVNDGSKDGSLNLIKEYKKSDD
ncbi:MAG: glycosyltransferase, partial [Terrisporobacter sp.]|uniref:glycosyltransferase n=1 Tax=Terrisporobacter sp. TaxID=1965305 RepID=UPI002A91DBB7